ncbi:uncharacterized protein LOC112043229 isoform X2 [Bicyclus anynana]|nr:uncharacterized protein LOC112043229 isoform X2 [Bicyclus anynana]XP_052742508.1 uncharacterized protein LOC112043229 isoform X2 [Bicyclus anynana]
MDSLIQLLVICLTATATLSLMQGKRFNIGATDKTPIMCTIDNRNGICVHEQACDENHRIIATGALDSSEMRSKVKGSCPANLWCCSEESIETLIATQSKTPDVIDGVTEILTKQPTSAPTASDAKACVAPQNDHCPWCVLLYYSIPEKQSDRLFCMGALVGSKAIITASTCIVGTKTRDLYAQLPNSADPYKRYPVMERNLHPNYNTGSHEYDFGVLVIVEDAATQKASGACLDFLVPFEGECYGYGFDVNGRILSTLLQVRDKSCGQSGSSVDAACGKNNDLVCGVAYGAPIICPAENGGLVLRGVSRGVCTEQNVLLGGILRSKTWIEEVLNSIGVSTNAYT